MLKKLLKYNLINTYKGLIIFYSMSIFFSILTRIFLSIEKSFILNIIGQICSGVSISMIFNIIINNMIRLWVRFKQNLYGDESYLTHTLPIEKKTLYLSKIITAIVSLFTSTVIIALTLFIAYYSKENIEIIKSILLPIANTYNSTILTILLAFSFILFLEFLNILQCGYTGIILGHKMNNARTGYSFLYGFISFIISQLLVLITIFLIGLFNKDIMNLLFTNELINISTIKSIIYIAIGVYTSTIIIDYIANIKLFKQGVNVE